MKSGFRNFDRQRLEFQEITDELELLKDKRYDTNIGGFSLEFKLLVNEFTSILENSRRLHAKNRELDQEVVKISQDIHNELQKCDLEQQHCEVLLLENERKKKIIKISKEDLKNEQIELVQLKKECKYLKTIHEDKYIKEKKELSKRLATEDNISKEYESRKNELYETVKGLKSKENIKQKRYSYLLKKRLSIEKTVKTLSERLKNFCLEIENKQLKLGELGTFLEQKKKEAKENSDIFKGLELTHFEKKKEMSSLESEEKKKFELLKVKENKFLHTIEREKDEKQKRDRSISSNAKLDTEKEHLEEQLVNYDKEIQVLIKKTNKYNIKKHKFGEKIKKLLKEKTKIIKNKNEINFRLTELTEENKNLKKDVENNRQEIEDLNHQRKMLLKKTATENSNEEKMKNVITVMMNRKRNLIQNIARFRKDAESDRKNVNMLEEQQKMYKFSVIDLVEKCENVEEKKKILEMLKTEMELKIEKEEKKLKRQGALYDEVENDRNTMFKRMSKIEMLSKIQSKKFFILLTAIKHVKSEISNRDKGLQQLSIKSIQLKEEIKILEKLRKNLHQSILSIKLKIRRKEEQVNKLNELIRNTVDNKEKQKREIESLINERDILGNNLIQRNNQIINIYEQMKINQEKVNNGNLEFQKKMEEIEMLKERENSLAIRIIQMKKLLAQELPLKVEIGKLRKDLVREKMKLTVLLEENNICMNIHHYRKLESSHPEIFKMISTIYQLQKEIISYSKKLHVIDGSIKEKEILYKQLRKFMEKQPKQESKEQLRIFQKNLKKKNKQVEETKRKLKEYKQLVKTEGILSGEYEKDFRNLSSQFKKRFFKMNIPMY